MKCGLDRLAIRAVATTASGTVTSAMSDSSGEIHEHHHQDRDHHQHRVEQLRDGLLQRLRQIVEVVGDAAEQSPRAGRVVVAQRQPVDLRPRPGAQLPHGHRALHDVQQVQPASHTATTPPHRGRGPPSTAALADRPEVDAAPGTTSIDETMSAKVPFPSRAVRRRPGPW